MGNTNRHSQYAPDNVPCESGRPPTRKKGQFNEAGNNVCLINHKLTSALVHPNEP
jgi:hypothetical protein